MKEKLVKVTYMGVGALIAFAAYLLGNVNDNINAQPQDQLPIIDKIVVRQLEVVDANGNTVAVLGKRDLPLGMADILRVYDGTGKSIILLAQGTDGGMVHVFDKEGKNSSASLGIHANAGVVQAIDEAGSKSVLHGGAVVVQSKDGETGVVLNTDVNGGNVSIAGKNGKSGVLLNTDINGGNIAVADKNGILGVVLDISSDGGSVSVTGKNGKIGTVLEPDKNGGAMAIFNNGGQNVLQIGVTHTGGGAVNTKDKFGYITGNVP